MRLISNMRLLASCAYYHVYDKETAWGNFLEHTPDWTFHQPCSLQAITSLEKVMRYN